jgi:hypothetical protein
MSSRISYSRCLTAFALAGVLLLPTASQRLVESYQSQQFIKSCLGQVEFGGKVICLICQHLQIAGVAALIAKRAPNVGVRNHAIDLETAKCLKTLSEELPE